MKGRRYRRLDHYLLKQVDFFNDSKSVISAEAEETIETPEVSSQNSEVNRPSLCDLLRLRKETPHLHLPIDAVLSVLSFHSVF